MNRISVLRQDDFTGGLNLRADQFQLNNNESPRMRNVEIDPRGGVFSRGAMRRINTLNISANWKPRSCFPFYGTVSNVPSSFLMFSTGYEAAVNGNVFYSQGGDFNPLNIDVTAEAGASFAPWGSKLYIAAGRNTANIVKWDGSTKTSLTPNGGTTWQNDYDNPVGGHAPRADLTIVHAGKLFVANTYENGVPQPNRIRWSHPNNPENFAELDRIDITTGGDGITGLASFNGQLLIFKPHAVFALFGFDSDSFQVVEVSRTVGVARSHCVATTEYGVYFFSYPDGLFFYDGQRMTDVFEHIRPAIVNGYVPPVAAETTFVSYINRRIWVSLPYSDTTTVEVPSAAFVLDPSIRTRGTAGGAWVMFTVGDGTSNYANQYSVTGGCSWIRDDGTVRHVAPHSTQAQVLSVDRYDQTQDNVTGTDRPFESLYRTRWLDAGSYSQKKMFRRPDLVVKQVPTAVQIGIEVYGDYEEAEGSEVKSYVVTVPGSSSGFTWGNAGTGLWGSAVWGAANTGSQIINGRNIGLAKSIQIEFTNVVENAPQAQKWGLNSYTLKYIPRRVKS